MNGKKKTKGLPGPEANATLKKCKAEIIKRKRRGDSWESIQLWLRESKGVELNITSIYRFARKWIPGFDLIALTQKVKDAMERAPNEVRQSFLKEMETLDESVNNPS